MENNIKKEAWWKPGLIIFSQMSAWIVGPVIFALFLGKYLDNKFNTDPWIFITLFALAFLVSMIAVIKIGVKYKKKLDIK